ncbi:MAG: protein kinase domain-containing protein [Luteolibacter sp.]
MTFSSKDQASPLDERDDASLPEAITHRIDPFVDFLYEEGDPASAGLGEVSQTPLYDTLRDLDQRYADHTLVATGGMKEIYRALDRRTSRHVAIARPLQTLGIDHYDAFLREAHITAKLEHPGIIKLFGMGVDESGRPFFTMEFKAGRSLREIINDHKKSKSSANWPLSQRLGIILRICESLAYAHSKRVLHLDIKPDNIQVGSFGEVQLCDWGMGVVMQSEEHKQSETLLDPDLYGSLQRNIKGTPMYMAPELFDAKNAKTVQMDIYSLGCLIEELIHAEPPGSGKKQLLAKDSPLYAVVEKAKAKRPSDRYSSVTQIHRDISRYLEGFSMSVEEPSVLRELSLFYQRHRTACNITLAFLLTLIAAVSLFLNGLNKSRNEARDARDQAFATLADLEKEKYRSETRLKNQAESARMGSSELMQLEFREQLNLETLTDQLHARLDDVIANQPSDDTRIWVAKFWLDFVTQRFDHAVQLHEDGKRTSEDLVPLAQKYASRLGDAEYLNTADFNELLSELFAIKDMDRSRLAEKIMRYDLKNPRTAAERIEILHQMLKLLNPDWKNQIFTYSEVDHSLRLGGQGLTRLRQSEHLPTVLNIIEPRKLDLSHTSIAILEGINLLHLTEIDLRGTLVKSLRPLAEMRTLSRLIVTQGQFSEKDLAELPSFIEVVVRK